MKVIVDLNRWYGGSPAYRAECRQHLRDRTRDGTIKRPVRCQRCEVDGEEIFAVGVELVKEGLKVACWLCRTCQTEVKRGRVKTITIKKGRR
jgi:hypothetical protein